MLGLLEEDWWSFGQTVFNLSHIEEITPGVGEEVD